MKNNITYYYRGQIERRYSSGRCKWINGYSEQGVHGALYPWLGLRECQTQAKLKGCKAVFVH